MKKPRTDRFDPNQPQQHIQPEEVDFSGVPEIKEATPASQRPPAATEESKGTEAQAQRKDAVPASQPATEQSPEHASTLASKEDDVIERIRKVVKDVGKEVAYVRLTPDEKRRLEDVVHAYKQREIKTSETEVLRIALTWLLEDYVAREQTSVLERVIEALNA